MQLPQVSCAVSFTSFYMFKHLLNPDPARKDVSTIHILLDEALFFSTSECWEHRTDPRLPHVCKISSLFEPELYMAQALRFFFPDEKQTTGEQEPVKAGLIHK